MVLSKKNFFFSIKKLLPSLIWGEPSFTLSEQFPFPTRHWLALSYSWFVVSWNVRKSAGDNAAPIISYGRILARTPSDAFWKNPPVFFWITTVSQLQIRPYGNTDPLITWPAPGRRQNGPLPKSSPQTQLSLPPNGRLPKPSPRTQLPLPQQPPQSRQPPPPHQQPPLLPQSLKQVTEHIFPNILFVEPDKYSKLICVT